MLSKTTGENYVGQLPTHVAQTLKFIQILRDNNSDLFQGYEDILHTFHFNSQIILRAKRGILLATPSMHGHFNYATDMTYESNNKDFTWVFDCLNDLLATIELQGKYKMICVQEKLQNKKAWGGIQHSYWSYKGFCVGQDDASGYRNDNRCSSKSLIDIFSEKYNFVKCILDWKCNGIKYCVDEDSYVDNYGEETKSEYLEYQIIEAI